MFLEIRQVHWQPQFAQSMRAISGLLVALDRLSVSHQFR